MTRMSIPEAANRLNVSVDSVRRRLRSGVISGERDARGQWWLEVADTIEPAVPLPSVDQRLAMGVVIPAPPSPEATDRLVEALQDRIDDLLVRLDRSEAERRDDKTSGAAERDRLLRLIETLARPATAAQG